MITANSPGTLEERIADAVRKSAEDSTDSADARVGSAHRRQGIASIRLRGDEGAVPRAFGCWTKDLADDWARQWDDGVTEYSA